MRAFLALSLPEPVCQSLAALQQELSTAGSDVGWVQPDQLHLTLKFLDDISEEQRQAIEQRAAAIAAAVPRIELSLGELGAFPTTRAPRIIWVGAKLGRQQIVDVATQLEAAARELGLRREERPFSAHVTLGRVRSSRGQDRLIEQMQQVAWTPPAPWTVEAITLYLSILGSAGAQHTVLAEWPFGQKD